MTVRQRVTSYCYKNKLSFDDKDLSIIGEEVANIARKQKITIKKVKTMEDRRPVSVNDFPSEFMATLTFLIEQYFTMKNQDSSDK